MQWAAICSDTAEKRLGAGSIFPPSVVNTHLFMPVWIQVIRAMQEQLPRITKRRLCCLASRKNAYKQVRFH